LLGDGPATDLAKETDARRRTRVTPSPLFLCVGERAARSGGA
jgi:hypothetical protein